MSVIYLREFHFQTIRHRCPSARGFPGREARFWYPLLPALTSLKRFVFRGLMRSPPARSHLKRFWLEIAFSFGFGAQVFSRPRFLSSGLGLARLELKSLRFCSTFCVYVLKTIVNVDSKSKLCAPNDNVELFARVLWCFQIHYKTLKSE